MNCRGVRKGTVVPSEVTAYSLMRSFLGQVDPVRQLRVRRPSERARQHSLNRSNECQCEMYDSNRAGQRILDVYGGKKVAHAGIGCFKFLGAFKG